MSELCQRGSWSWRDVATVMSVTFSQRGCWVWRLSARLASEPSHAGAPPADLRSHCVSTLHIHDCKYWQQSWQTKHADRRSKKKEYGQRVSSSASQCAPPPHSRPGVFSARHSAVLERRKLEGGLTFFCVLGFFPESVTSCGMDGGPT